MEFSVGDKIMHPRFGAGRITGEAHRELVKGFEHYYVINVIGTGATAYVPMDNMGELGVRPVMSRAKIAQVFTTLRSLPSLLSDDYKRRQAQIQEKLGTRRPVAIAEVVRDLTWHGERKHLTQKDETLLSQGCELLASEIALATDTQIPDAQETIDNVLRVALAGDESESDNPREGITAAAAKTEPLLQKLLERVGRGKGS